MTKKIVVIGPNGGIGGYVAAHLAHAINTGKADGWELSGLVHSPASLNAIRDNGLVYYDENPQIPGQHNRLEESFFVSNDANDLGPQDVIICATPASAMPLEQIEIMTVPQKTIVIPLLNGIPFWYPELFDIDPEAMTLIDPERKILNELKRQGAHLIGSIVDVAGVKIGPGEVEGHPAINEGGDFVHGNIHLGVIDSSNEHVVAQCAELIELFQVQCGMPTNHLKNKEALLRQFWVKIAGNIAANYGAAMYDKHLPELFTDQELGPYLKDAIEEALRVGLHHGLPAKFEKLIPKLTAMVVKAKVSLNGHYTSTHAAFENGDPDCEMSVILKPVVLLALKSGLEASHIKSIHDHFQAMLLKRDELAASGEDMKRAAINARQAILQA